MKNKSEDLRNHLFAALEGLADTEKPMDIERAKAICDVAQVVINLAKVETEYAKAMNVQVNGVISIATDKQPMKRIA